MGTRCSTKSGKVMKPEVTVLDNSQFPKTVGIRSVHGGDFEIYVCGRF